MISVVLTTANRADSLRLTLEAMSNLQAPVGGWLLLIVDNASKDHTQDVISSFRDRLPIKSLHYSVPGKNAALNSAISAFQGDLIVFTDDDVLPHPDWLVQHRSLADALPGYDVFGGCIEPVWPETPPNWIIKRIPLTVCFAATPSDWSSGPCPPQRVWGGNMSVRAEVFKEGHRFDLASGPKFGDNRYLTGGETRFTRRIHEGGHRCYYSPAPLVGHIIRAEQFDYRWIMARGFRSGRLRAANEVLGSGIWPIRRLKAWLRWLVLELRCEAYAWRATRAELEPWRADRDWTLNVSRGAAYQRMRSPTVKPANLMQNLRYPEPSLIISLKPPMGPDDVPYYSAGRKRIATVTAVRFLDEHRLLATHLYGRRMYLVSFDFETGHSTIAHEIPTVYGNEAVITDLIDVNAAGLIAVSNFNCQSITLYRLADDRLAHWKDLAIRDDGAGRCHGIKFTPQSGIVCASCTTGERNVYFVSIDTGEVLYKFSHGDWRPKDICFVSENLMVIVYAYGSPSAKASAAYESKASLVRIDVGGGRHDFLSEVTLPACQVDCCVYKEGFVYIADQMDDCVRVCKLDGDTITFHCKLPGYSFPHGVDALPEANLLAVTNYGTSDIVITRLDQSLAAGIMSQARLVMSNDSP
jgi:glycosyltransferase involved in cell wall biosynthesis